MSGADLSVRVALIESLLKCGEEQRGHAELGEFLDLPPKAQGEVCPLSVNVRG
jgi:hypothetical protein